MNEVLLRTIVTCPKCGHDMGSIEWGDALDQAAVDRLREQHECPKPRGKR